MRENNKISSFVHETDVLMSEPVELKKMLVEQLKDAKAEVIKIAKENEIELDDE